MVQLEMDKNFKENKMRFIPFLFIIIFPFILFSQNHDAYVVSQQGWVKMGAVYQSWKDADSNKLSEMSLPVQVYFPFTRSLALSLRGSQASATGTDLADLKGLTDTQITLTTHLEAAHLVFNLGLNIPSGRKELTMEEFATSSLVSLNQFNFKTPNWGQGLNIAPSFTWALPVSDNFVLGLGASYQIKGKYKPLEGMEEDYQPGNELSATAGFDLRLAETTTFSGDVLWTKYGEDKLGSETVFRSGDKLVATLQYRQYFGYNQLWLLGRYRSRAKNSLVIADELVPEDAKTTPDQIELFACYRMRLDANFNLAVLGEYRRFKETVVYTGVKFYGLGLAPEIRLSRNFTVSLQAKFVSGKTSDNDSLKGWEGSGGMVIMF